MQQKDDKSPKERHLDERYADSKWSPYLPITGDFSELKYTQQYVKLINNGTIRAGKPLIMLLNKVGNHYTKTYDFHPDQVEKRIQFIENHTAQTKGSNSQLKLMLPQKVWIEIPFGFYGWHETTAYNPDTLEEETAYHYARVVHEVPVVVGRGQGKTTISAAIALTGLLLDEDYGSDVNFIAGVTGQARMPFNAVLDMTRRDGTLLNMMVKEELLKATNLDIAHTPSNSTMKVLANNYDNLDGLNGHFNVFDEVHTYKDDPIKIVNDGSKLKRQSWMTWYFTTNGTLREATFDTYYRQWIDVVTGANETDAILPFLYQIDSVDDVADAIDNPEKRKNFQKANPLIGLIPALNEETIVSAMRDARGNLAHQSEMLAKVFNFPSQAHGAFFSNKEVEGNPHVFDNSLFDGSLGHTVPVILSADLAQVNDIAAYSLMAIDDEGVHHFKTFSFLPRQSLQQFSSTRQSFFLECAERGEIILHDEIENDDDLMFAHVVEYMDANNILPVMFAYDRWGSDRAVSLYKDTYGDATLPVAQGARSLSKPMFSYKNLLANEKLAFDNKLASWVHGNVVAEIDTNGNVKPSKKHSNEKIDLFASQLDAYAAKFLPEGIEILQQVGFLE